MLLKTVYHFGNDNILSLARYNHTKLHAPEYHGLEGSTISVLLNFVRAVKKGRKGRKRLSAIKGRIHNG